MAAIVLVLASVAILEGLERRRKAKLAKQLTDAERQAALQQESHRSGTAGSISSDAEAFAEPKDFELDDAASTASTLVDEKQQGSSKRDECEDPSSKKPKPKPESKAKTRKTRKRFSGLWQRFA